MSKTVLTVDDSASIRSAIAFALQPKGYKVIQAEDGRAGLAALKANAVDMVITDLNMPNMNGIEMIRAVRSDRTLDGVPIVLLTTESQKEKMLEGKQAGAAGWIVKPFDEQKICAVVSKMIG
ncbi:response regulator [Aestuariivita boseongensis]|uniref:response regulator n=1 Tax=Aestuariivita boseongensis TaxID=1470562 RepID=UPI000682C55D|nr:response regulator [Aestuariivita boseongensis]